MRKIFPRVSGSLTALATPFRDGYVDMDALFRSCQRQLERGTAALITCGSTGEAAALSAAEYSDVVAATVGAANPRIPVIAGCCAPSTAATIALGVEAAAAGADALLCAPPPYVKPTQCGIIAHIRAVAHATDLPIVIYDVPSRSGVAIADDTLIKMFENELIVGIKDATADLSRPPRLRAACEGLMQWSGDDAAAAAYRAMGGLGCISVTANVAPRLCAMMHRAWDDGDLRGFAALRDLLDPLHAALFAESNPIPLKAALEAIGLCSSEVRLPLTRATPRTQQRLLKLLERIMIAEEHAAHGPPYALAS